MPTKHLNTAVLEGPVAITLSTLHDAPNLESRDLTQNATAHLLLAYRGS